PGPDSLPDENYRREIPQLNTYDNVQTIGYVSTAWGARNLNSVLDDIAKYSGWAANNSRLGIKGIFFDETPSLFDSASAEYLDTLDTTVKTSGGLGPGLVSQSNSPSMFPTPC